MSMPGVSPRRIALVLLTAVGLLLVSELPAFASLPDTSDPSLSLDRTIRTRPFTGSSTMMKDHEGSAYVLPDNSLWMVDDNANAVYEMDATTGALKRMIPRSVFNSAPKFGGGPVAGTARTDDFESFAYDRTSDQLYLFSGPCCTSSVLPTAFRLTRQSGSLQVESYQPLASGANYTASAWNPADQKIYVGVGRQLRTYNYETNTAGSTFQIPDLAGILGMGFSSDGADLFVVTNAEVLKRVDWASKTVVPGWTFNLLPFGVLDSRGVELIGDQFYVSDGADSRASDDPLKYAVFVFDVQGSAPPPPPPPSGNLVGNPGFETDTSGWGITGSGTGVALTRVTTPTHTGGGAALLRNNSTGTRKCVLNDAPNWVTTTQAGTYSGSLWVRADSAGAKVKITFREINAGSLVGSRVVTYTLTTSWQQLTLTYAPVRAGTSTLDLQVFVPKDFAPPGVCFYADDASILRS
jgi:hypothetical protein